MKELAYILLAVAALLAFVVVDYRLARIVDQLREIAEILREIRVQRS